MVKLSGRWLTAPDKAIPMPNIAPPIPAPATPLLFIRQPRLLRADWNLDAVKGSSERMLNQTMLVTMAERNILSMTKFWKSICPRILWGSKTEIEIKWNDISIKVFNFVFSLFLCTQVHWLHKGYRVLFIENVLKEVRRAT